MSNFLTFNYSVADKQLLSTLSIPFQIMPMTNGFLRDSDIERYSKCKSNNILVHLNYITMPFGKNIIEPACKARAGLKQYAKLCKKIGTKNLLIHMPKSKTEIQLIET